jgi:hypothetical protein
LEDPCQKTVEKISEKLYKEERERNKEKKQGFKTRSTLLYKNLESKAFDSPTKPNLRDVVQPPKKLSQIEQEREDKANQLSQKLKK